MSRAARPARQWRRGARAHPTAAARRRARAAARRRPRRCSRCRTRAPARRPACRSAACHPRGQRGVGDRLHDLARAGALHGEHRVVVQTVVHLRVEPRGVRAEPLQIARVVGGVGDRQEALGLQAVGEEVVEHPPVLAAEHAVLRAAHGDRGDVVGEQPLQQRAARRGRRSRSRPCARRRRSRSPRAPPCARRARRWVLHGHLPAGELDHLRAGGDVAVVQSGAARGIGHGAQVIGDTAQSRSTSRMAGTSWKPRALATLPAACAG